MIKVRVFVYGRGDLTPRRVVYWMRSINYTKLLAHQNVPVPNLSQGNMQPIILSVSTSALVCHHVQQRQANLTTVGYKEFREFLADSGASQEMFAEAIEQMKHSTRKYAKRQVSWLRNKLLPAVQSVPSEYQLKASLYLLDATGKSISDMWTGLIPSITPSSGRGLDFEYFSPSASDHGWYLFHQAVTFLTQGSFQLF